MLREMLSHDIDWNASEGEYLGEFDDDEVDNSMRLDPLDMAEVSFSVGYDFVNGI